MNTFKKTRMMNIFGAVGWAVVGVALFLNKNATTLSGVVIAVSALYVLLVAVATMSARALSVGSTSQLRRLMIWANWSLIALWVPSMLVALYMHVGLPQVLLGTLAFVLPEALNIRALRKSNQWLELRQI